MPYAGISTASPEIFWNSERNKVIHMTINNTAKKAGIILAYPLAYAYLKYMLFYSGDLAILAKSLFTAGFIALNELVLRGRGKKAPTVTYFWYLIMVILAVTCNTGLNSGVTMFALHLCAIYITVLSSGILLEGRTGSFIIADLFNAAVIKAFSGVPKIFTDIADIVKSNKANKDSSKEKSEVKTGVPLTILVVIVTLPVFAVAIFLLTQINDGFAQAVVDLIESIDFDIDPLKVISEIFYLVFAVPVCIYFYGMVSKCSDSDGAAEHKTCGSLKNFREACHKVSPVACSVVSGCFVALYLVFFVFEGSYLFSAFAGHLPEEFTAAAYARKGFFELTGIMLINMLIFLLISYFENRKLIGRRISAAMVISLMSESVLFATISFSKLALYYSRFGYTPKRLLAIWGTLIFAAGAVMVIVSTVRRKDLSRVWIYFATASFVVMNIVSSVLYLVLGGIEI